MFHALNWFAVLVLLALWSLVSWAVHAIVAWTASHAPGLQGASSEVLSLQLPDWLAPWVPPEFATALPELLSALTPTVEYLLGLAPAFAGVFSVAVWVVWAIGGGLLILLGIVLSGVIAMLGRRRMASPA